VPDQDLLRINDSIGIDAGAGPRTRLAPDFSSMIVVASVSPMPGTVFLGARPLTRRPIKEADVRPAAVSMRCAERPSPADGGTVDRRRTRPSWGVERPRLSSI